MTEDKNGGLRARAQAAQEARKADEESQPGAAVATIGQTPAEAMLTEWQPYLEQALVRHIRADHFIRFAATGLQNSKQARQLAKCTRPSIYTALMQCAHFGLMPFTDEAAIVPFGDVATFIPQYQGFVTMFFRTGQVASVTAKLIYRRDKWNLAYGDGGGFLHEPRLFEEDGREIPRGGEKNPAILAYCYVTLRSGQRTEVEFVTRLQAEEVRDKYSKAYQNAEKSWNGRAPKRDSTWHTDFDKMWLKTAVRRAAKYAPKSPELLELLLHDNAADSTVEGQEQPWQPPAFEPGGPASAWPGDVGHGDGSVVEGEVVTDTEDRGHARGRDIRGLRALFTEAGWGDGGGEAHDVRMEVLAALLAEQGKPVPVFTTSAGLSDEQAAKAHRGLRKFLEGKDDAHAALRHLAEVTRQAREVTQPRGRRRSAGPAASRGEAADGGPGLDGEGENHDG